MVGPSSNLETTSATAGAAARRMGTAQGRDALVACLAAEMAQRWQQGERPGAEEFLARHSELGRQPEAAVDLIYEEICLRQDYGAQVPDDDVLRRFPQWRAQLEVLLRCDRILELGPPAPQFPAVGETLGDFQLVAELGRGLQGRVYLATQPALADRPVVLKVTPDDGREHLSLARLQHTHIVPLYAVQTDAARYLRLLCLPYFGGMTLAQLLDEVRSQPVSQRSGRLIALALERARAVAPLDLPASGPGLSLLARLSWEQAVCWIGASLADALHYAHERGLVHLDLKPSNVLLAADGQPMLLDFHLAQGPLRAGQPAPEELGGSPAYMSPEQRLALGAVSAGKDIPEAVDGRSDVYSLGILLYEALGGPVPDPQATTGSRVLPPLRSCNADVSVGLADVIHKCLAHDLGERYATAAAVADDLRRHLNHLPLRGVANRSLPERWRKWRRRRPSGLAVAGLLLAVLAAAAAAGIAAWAHVRQQLDEARTALIEGQEQIQQRHYADAVSTLQRGLRLAADLPGNADLTQELARQLRRAEAERAHAERAETARELHRQADRIRFHSSFEGLPAADLRTLEAHCRTWWERRHALAASPRPEVGPDGQHIGSDLLDLAILWTDLRVRLASGDAAQTARLEALRVLDEAEALFGPSSVLDLERRKHRQALGQPDAPPAFPQAPRTSWEHYALGRSLLRAGNLDEAARRFEQAVALSPQGLWPHFYQGLCAYRLGRHQDAILAFTVCVTLAPENTVCYYNRALAATALGRDDQALRDYDRALELEPALAPAALNRGLVHFRAGRGPEAIADLERALRHNANPAVVHYNLALVYRDQGDTALALASVQRALKHDPGHKEAQVLAESLRGKR